MNFYNCKRRHRSIGKITPREKWMEGLKIKSETNFQSQLESGNKAKYLCLCPS